jgi:hypothetical protein
MFRSDLLTLGGVRSATNHNLFAFLRGFIDANERTFRDNAAPQAIADMAGMIEELFMSESWRDMLDVHSGRHGASVKTGASIR